jgi:hypothetical protein
MKKIIITFGVILFTSVILTSCGRDSSSSSNSKTSSSNSQPSQNVSETLKCDECGTSFRKSTGVQLTGHSQVFCSNLCATRWGGNNGISVR